MKRIMFNDQYGLTKVFFFYSLVIIKFFVYLQSNQGLPQSFAPLVWVAPFSAFMAQLQSDSASKAKVVGLWR